MMDFIYDQQEIFNHYDEIFESRKIGDIEVRKPDFPFANLLGFSYDQILNEFQDENDIKALLNIRWCNFNDFEKEFAKKK